MLSTINSIIYSSNLWLFLGPFLMILGLGYKLTNRHMLKLMHQNPQYYTNVHNGLKKDYQKNYGQVADFRHVNFFYDDEVGQKRLSKIKNY